MHSADLYNLLQELSAQFPENAHLRRYVEDMKLIIASEEHEMTHARYIKGSSQNNLSGLAPEFVTDEIEYPHWSDSELEYLNKENAQLNFERQMKEKRLMEALEEAAPYWAARKAKPNTIEVMHQLLTKDGRAVGNAVIADIMINLLPGHEYEPVKMEISIIVITDAGNLMILSPQELTDLFYLGDWIMSYYPYPNAQEILDEYFE